MAVRLNLLLVGDLDVLVALNPPGFTVALPSRFNLPEISGPGL